MREKITQLTNQIREWWSLKRGVFALLLVTGVILIGWITWLTVQANRLGFGDKTYWEWMDLLLIPTALAVAGYWFSRAQKQAELEIADKARKEDREIAQQAREAEQEIAKQERDADREIALERQRQNTLDNYFDKMTELILDKALHTTEDENVKLLARARTHNILRELGSERNQQVILFLMGANLTDEEGLLRDADLRGANLTGTNLKRADLSGANLEGAHLEMADLEGAHLEGARLDGAYLEEAFIIRADLSRARLRGAHFSGTHLGGTHLGGTHLGGTHLGGADLSGADLSGAYLFGIDFKGAYLYGANFEGANLVMADLREAHLGGADLSGANLREAKPGDVSRLISEASSLKEATMPDGRKFEEWQADKFAAEQNEPLDTETRAECLTQPAEDLDASANGDIAEEAASSDSTP